MDVRHYKLATPVTAPWPGGGTCRLRPLPLSEMQAAEIAAQATPPRTRAVALALEAVSRALDLPLDSEALGLLLTPPDAALLLAHQRRAQSRGEVDTGVLREWLRRSVNDIPEVVEDGVLAWQCEQGPGQYYGQPVQSLTQAQVAWFLLLRAAFEHFHVGKMDSKGKMRKAKPREWWLAQDYEERRRWQIAC